MTCIVGIEHAAGVTIGVDSASSDGHSINTNTTAKLFRSGPYLFGFTSSWRMGQLLQYRLEVPEPDTWDIDRWMATRFVDAVRDTLKAGGFARAEQGTEFGGTFLVAVAGRLYAVHNDYQAAHAAEGYQAVGSGARVALGSLHTTRHPLADSPAARCEAALDAAAHHTTTVRGPFAVETLWYGGSGRVR